MCWGSDLFFFLIAMIHDLIVFSSCEESRKVLIEWIIQCISIDGEKTKAENNVLQWMKINGKLKCAYKLRNVYSWDRVEDFHRPGFD